MSRRDNQGLGKQQSQFEALIFPHAAALLRFGRRLCGSHALAEDLVQDALLRAWRAADALPGVANPRAWVFRILLNTWYSEGRRRSARPVEASLHHARNHHARSLAEPPREVMSDVREALGLLPEDQQTVILLAVVEGFTSREIAEILEIAAGTVMSRLSRARAAMRDHVSGNLHKTGVGSR